MPIQSGNRRTRTKPTRRNREPYQPDGVRLDSGSSSGTEAVIQFSKPIVFNPSLKDSLQWNPPAQVVSATQTDVDEITFILDVEDVTEVSNLSPNAIVKTSEGGILIASGIMWT